MCKLGAEAQTSTVCNELAEIKMEVYDTDASTESTRLFEVHAGGFISSAHRPADYARVLFPPPGISSYSAVARLLCVLQSRVWAVLSRR
jgi:hypothetical protein